MQYTENPFTPSFGEAPAHLAGRKPIIDDAVRALKSVQRRPELTTLFSGARGTGKTTLLSLLASKAEELGWVSVSVTALPGMLEDIELTLQRNASHLLDGNAQARVSKVGIPQIVDISFERDAQQAGNWRSRMTNLIEQLARHDIGLLMTVDEVDPSLNEMVQLAAVYQHFVREERKVSLLMAGLPHNISTLLGNKTVSFLRRAHAVKLGRIANCDIKAALLKTIEDGGREADGNGVNAAVEAIGGFPFLMQLVGYRAWDIHPNNKLISCDDFSRSIDLAHDEMRSRILEATYRELSAEDTRFLSAMLEDQDESRASDLVERLQRSSAQVAQYRRRLIEAGVIGERRRGVVAFELPFFREYLEEELGRA